MVLELGVLLLVAPERLNNLAVAPVLLGIALAVTWVAARVSRGKTA